MNTISIFLGSSHTLSHERVLIGDNIRKLSDLWEKKGVRLHLLVWEDYKAEYKGQSKQTDYDLDLVGKADIVITMFRERVGLWIEHELDIAQTNHCTDIHCFCLPSSNRDSIVSYLQGKLLHVTEVNNGNTIIQHLTTIVEQYISKHNLETSDTSTYPTKSFYATIPSDAKNYRVALGNIIRSLDMLSEQQLNVRCRLHPYCTPSLIIGETDHYLGIFKTKTTHRESDEFKLALKQMHENYRPEAITIFKVSGGNLLNANHEIALLLKEKEIFTVGINNNDRLYLKLLLWLYSTSIPNIKPDDVNISIRDFKIHFFGHPVADLSSLENGKQIKELIARKQILDDSFSRIQKSTDSNRNNKLAIIDRKRAAINSNIMQMLAIELNKYLFEPSLYIIDETQPVDTEEILQTVKLEANQIQQLKINIGNNWRNDDDVIYHRIEYLRGNLNSENQLEEISKLLNARNQILLEAYRNQFVQSKYVFETLQYAVSVCDTYNLTEYDFDENVLFGQIVKLSDETRVTNPDIEMMRLNYGNSFARIGDYTQAQENYETALNHFKLFACETPAERKNLAHLYVSIVMHTIERTPHSGDVKEWISEFMQLSSRWFDESPRYIIERAMALCCHLAEVEFVPYIADKEAKEAEAIFEQLLAYPHLQSDDQLYGDIYCFFPNIIGRYYIEQNSIVNIEDRKEYIEKAYKYFKIVLEKIAPLENIEYSEYLTHFANANHNLGYLYVKENQNKQAVDYYNVALAARRTIFVASQSPRDEVSVAETLVNACWAFINELESAFREQRTGKLLTFASDPISMANEALEIYTRYNVDGMLGPETNYYKSLMLVGYLNILLSITNVKTDADFGMECLRKCFEWDDLHPENDQHGRIMSIKQNIKDFASFELYEK